MRTMAIVASGTSLLGRSLGEEIDAHDGVTRFGGAEWSLDLGVNTEDVGKRYTHWVINGHAPALHRCRDRSYMGYYEGVTVLFKEKNWGKKWSIPHIGLKTRTRRSLKRNKVHFRTLTRGKCTSQISKSGVRWLGGKSVFSAGFQAAMDTLGRFDLVTLYGFDHMYPECRTRGHYYDTKKWVDNGHKLGHESLALECLTIESTVSPVCGTIYKRGGDGE
ncbi:MAG: hypothetical protein CMF45_08815 [Legionellales bacterium]|nr:hypothetical protein [Legionellales bacterium]